MRKKKEMKFIGGEKDFLTQLFIQFKIKLCKNYSD